jgi:hypothetical protein
LVISGLATTQPYQNALPVDPRLQGRMRMGSIPKTSIVLAILIVIFNSEVANAQKTSSQAELQVVLSVVSNGTSIPMFEIELTNTGKHDLILNLGYMYGRRLFASAIHLSLKDAQNKTEILDLKGPPIIAGRVDPFVVPLPKGARIILPINLADFAGYSIPQQEILDIQLKPGRYFLSAEYRGEGVEHANLDMLGIRSLPYWLGRLDSSEISFVVPEK